MFETTVPYLRQSFATERQVEVPLGLAFLGLGGPGARVLEVGNVLRQHGAPPHTVVDRYEVGPGVLNEDVVSYSADDRYDQIVSISTLEHVGFDEVPREPDKFVRAIDHLLHDLLRPGGMFLATVPLGYNPEVDAWLEKAHLQGCDVRLLRRIDAFNDWLEVPFRGEASIGESRRYPGSPWVAVISVGVRSLSSARPEGQR